MPTQLAVNWGALALRGVVAILFGLIAFFTPLITLYTLTMLFAVYALLDGIVSLVAAVRSARSGQHWWELLFEGVFGLGAAVITFMWPGVTLVVLIMLIAFWAILTGIFEILAAIRLRKQITGEWLLILAGAMSVLFGGLLIAEPIRGAIVLAWWIGAYVFLFGIILLVLAFRMRKWHVSSPLQET